MQFSNGGSDIPVKALKLKWIFLRKSDLEGERLQKRDDGTEPESSFRERDRASSVGMDPRVPGIKPLRELSSALKCRREEQLDVAEGRVPYRRLESSQRYSSCWRAPMVEGICPNKRLKERLISWS